MTDNCMPGRRRLRFFTGAGYDQGAPTVRCAAWVLLGQPVVRSILCPPGLRVAVLRAFGARVGSRVLIRAGVRVHWPWKLTIGDDCWVGVDAWILNLEPVHIGSDVCISQGVLLCTGSHRADSPTFEFDNAPIVIGDGAWIAVRATVLRGVSVGADAVVGAQALVVEDVPPGVRVLAPRAVSRSQSDASSVPCDRADDGVEP